MKSLAKRINLLSKRVQLILISMLVVVGLAVSLAFVVHNRQNIVLAADKDTSLVTVRDGSDSKTITVQLGSTVADAVRAAGFVLADKDSLEPSDDTKIDNTEYNVNIYRAKSVLVIDGSNRQYVVTSHRDGESIAQDAGLTLRSEDLVTVELSDNISDGAGLVVTVKRAHPLHLIFYGKDETVYTQADTVQQFLDEKSITLASDDRMSLDKNAQLTDDSMLRIWREGKQTISVDEDVPFDTQTVNDANQPITYNSVKTTGVNGRRTVTYEIVIQDGVEVSRTEIASITTLNPVTQVNVKGTKITLPAGSHEDWMAAAGVSSSDYGYINYIFTRESGWTPSSSNPSGSYVGLGQTSPSKLSAACPNWRSDPVCQIKLFNSYAQSRYGAWSNAYAVWRRQGWW